MIALATSFLDCRGSSSLPLRSISVTLLVSYPNPAPSSRSELSTMKSRFLRSSLSCALLNSSLVSSANPTIRWSGRFIAPSDAAMSGLGLSVSVISPLRFILVSDVWAGVKSATAAQSMAASDSGKCSIAASYICCADVTSILFIPGFTVFRLTGPAIRVTSAPRAAHSSASAKPILPVE